MTSKEFNEKYSQWLEEGHYGLAIDDEEVIKFLDKIFQDLIKIDHFSYAQIKTKFNMARFYANGVSGAMCSIIEDRINKILRIT